MNRSIFLILAAAVVVMMMAAACTVQPLPAPAPEPPPLTEWQVFDLTQPLTPDMPIWPGDPEFEIEPWATYEVDDYFINRISIGEHSGTHWGTPNTFIEGARSADMIPPDELVMPAVVFDIRETAGDDVDYRFSVDDVKAWEAENGTVPAGSIAILYTGWQDKWDDPQAFLGLDDEGILHWPGFSAEAVEFLANEREIVALGTDTHGADPGNDEEFGASFAMYDADGAIIECLAGLDQIPPVGATIVAGGLPIQGGSGSPARVLAFMPPAE